MDWTQSKLDEELALQDIITAQESETLRHKLKTGQEGRASIAFVLEGLDAYGESWGTKAALWLVMAVVRMIREILADFSSAQFGMVPPSGYYIVCAEEDQQEITHLCLTAYQDIYNILLSTHRKASSPIWHRRALTQYFPQLRMDIDIQGDLILGDETLPE